MNCSKRIIRYTKIYKFSNNSVFQEVVGEANIGRGLLTEIYGYDVGELVLLETEKTITIDDIKKGVRYDILLKDKAGNTYIIEMESVGKFHPRRARYYSSIIDSYMLRTGKTYEELDDVTVIAITKTDQFKKGKSLYRFRKTDMVDKDIILNDGVEHIYLNTKGDGQNISKALKEFLDLIEDSSIDTINKLETPFAKKVAERYLEVLNNRKVRRSAMLWEVGEKFRQLEYEEIGRAEGQETGFNNAKDIIRLHKKGYNADEISLITGMSLEKVMEMVELL